jgi:signal transduction histidine kinase
MALSRLAYSALNNLETALGRAKRAEDARKELLATMSHEIRTPLNGIISVSDLLAKHKHAETTHTYLNIISLSAANLLEVVNDSLGRARSDHLGDIDAVDISVSNDPFNPTEILQQTCDLFTALAEQKGLWIGTYGLESLPETLMGDAPHLRQVMSNLVSNSIKFTNKGGIRLGARRLDETRDGVVIQFFVQDTGVGIEDEALQTVFERFGQSASAQSTKAQGTGLGLAICDDLVAAMGGTLDVHSTLGTGSTFSFTLTLPQTECEPTEVAA